MPRPSSKVLNDPSAPDLSPEDATVTPLKLVRPPSRGPRVIPPMSKGETRAQIQSFKEALKKAREPLVEREGRLREASKALGDHDKGTEAVTATHVKAQATAEKIYAKEIAARDKLRKALLKATEAAQASVTKASEQFAKGESKINAQIKGLMPGE